MSNSNHKVRYYVQGDNVKPLVWDADLGIPRVGDQVMLNYEPRPRTVFAVVWHAPTIPLDDYTGRVVADVHLTALEPD